MIDGTWLLSATEVNSLSRYKAMLLDFIVERRLYDNEAALHELMDVAAACNGHLPYGKQRQIHRALMRTGVCTTLFVCLLPTSLKSRS